MEHNNKKKPHPQSESPRESKKRCSPETSQRDRSAESKTRANSAQKHSELSHKLANTHVQKQRDMVARSRRDLYLDPVPGTSKTQCFHGEAHHFAKPAPPRPRTVSRESYFERSKHYAEPSVTDMFKARAQMEAQMEAQREVQRDVFENLKMNFYVESYVPDSFKVQASQEEAQPQEEPLALDLPKVKSTQKKPFSTRARFANPHPPRTVSAPGISQYQKKTFIKPPVPKPQSTVELLPVGSIYNKWDISEKPKPPSAQGASTSQIDRFNKHIASEPPNAHSSRRKSPSPRRVYVEPSVPGISSASTSQRAAQKPLALDLPRSKTPSPKAETSKAQPSKIMFIKPLASESPKPWYTEKEALPSGSSRCETPSPKAETPKTQSQTIPSIKSFVPESPKHWHTQKEALPSTSPRCETPSPKASPIPFLKPFVLESPNHWHTQKEALPPTSSRCETPSPKALPVPFLKPFVLESPNPWHTQKEALPSTSSRCETPSPKASPTPSIKLFVPESPKNWHTQKDALASGSSRSKTPSPSASYVPSHSADKESEYQKPFVPKVRFALDKTSFPSGTYVKLCAPMMSTVRQVMKAKDDDRSLKDPIKNPYVPEMHSETDDEMEEEEQQQYAEEVQEEALPQAGAQAHALVGQEDEADDEEYRLFRRFYDGLLTIRGKPIEKVRTDILRLSEDISLVTSVPVNLDMSSRLNRKFRETFEQIETLRSQNGQLGGMIFLRDNSRFIFYLLTRSNIYARPDYYDIWTSLRELRDHVKLYKVRKIALPKVEAGILGNRWNIIQAMIQFLFREVNCSITLCVPRSYGCSVHCN